MPVDHSRKLVFVHIPKTGGTSILTLLGLWQSKRSPNMQTLFGDLGNMDLQHLTLSQIAEFLTPEEFMEYRKFAIVRNPWDRAVSAAFWRTKFPEAGIRDLRDYVDWAERVNRKRTLTGSDVHAMPQCCFLSDEGSPIAVDRIARFETFDRDIQDILAPYVDISRPVPHKLKRTEQGAYRDFYTPDLVRRVEKIYADDVQRFGYEF